MTQMKIVKEKEIRGFRIDICNSFQQQWNEIWSLIDATHVFDAYEQIFFHSWQRRHNRFSTAMHIFWEERRNITNETSSLTYFISPSKWEMDKLNCFQFFESHFEILVIVQANL